MGTNNRGCRPKQLELTLDGHGSSILLSVENDELFGTVVLRHLGANCGNDVGFVVGFDDSTVLSVGRATAGIINDGTLAGVSDGAGVIEPPPKRFNRANVAVGCCSRHDCECTVIDLQKFVSLDPFNTFSDEGGVYCVENLFVAGMVQKEELDIGI